MLRFFVVQIEKTTSQGKYPFFEKTSAFLVFS
jgi:hypothetical protein